MAEAKKKKTIKEKKISEKAAPIKQSSSVAVLSILGKQHVVSEGDVISVENIGLEPGTKATDFDVLLFEDINGVEIGTPKVAGVKAVCEVLENYKGEKIDVIKFKAKSRYAKKIGYRSHLSKIKVISLEKGGTHGS